MTLILSIYLIGYSVLIVSFLSLVNRDCVLELGVDTTTGISCSSNQVGKSSNPSKILYHGYDLWGVTDDSRSLQVRQKPTET